MRGQQMPNVGKLLAAVGLMLVLEPGQASGAVKVCREAITGDEMKAPREIDARQLALRSWATLASLHGEAFASWRAAAGRSLSCRRLADSLVHCQARASPCGLTQTAPSQQPGGPGIAPRQPAPPPAPKGETRI